LAIRFLAYLSVTVPRLSRADWQAVHDFLCEAEAVDGTESLPRSLLARLAALTGADAVTFSELDRDEKRILAETSSADDEDDDIELFWRIVDRHPLCRHHAETGRLDAIKLSDFGGRRARRRLEIYTDWYGRYGIVDELEAGLWPSQRFTKTLILESFSRDFTERDRNVLNVLRPHLAALYRRGLERAKAADVLAALETTRSVGVIALEQDGRVGFATAIARDLVRAYTFEQLDRQLPTLLAAWLTQQQQNTIALVPSSSPALVLERPGARLVVRRAGSQLVLAEEKKPTRRLTEHLDLTRREQDVLALVADGRSNAEIAAALWITTSTVRKHLEHVYNKLGVNNRTAAIASTFADAR
jgi:DNA-binding CsgD family transcriptional regulator